MIPIFLCVGLIVLVWALDTACSTFQAGPGSWARFRENWKIFGRVQELTCARMELGVPEPTGEVKYVKLSPWARLVTSFRAIPPSRGVHYGVRIERDTVGGLRPPDAIEKSESDQAGIQNEAKTA